MPEIAFALLLVSTSATSDTLDGSGHAPPAMVERLRAECLRKRVRVTTELARYDVRVGRLDDVGLGGFKRIGSSPHPPDPIAWPSVVRIEAVRTRSRLGMGIGAATALSIGLPFASDHQTALVTWTLVGGWFGGQVGSRITRGEPVYVAQPRTPSPLPVAAAPAVAPAAIDEARVEKACAQIRHDRLLRVTFEDMPSVEGYALKADGNGLHSLQPKERSGSGNSLPEVISWSRIDGIQRRSSNAGSFATKGAVLVGVLGALSGIALAAGPGIGGSGSASGGEIAAVAGVGALIGAAIGGSLGALFGAPIPMWKVVY